MAIGRDLGDGQDQRDRRRGGRLPRNTWHAIGASDFNGDSFSDILRRNTNGQAAIWEMNGTTQIPGGSQILAANPGPSWHAVKV